MVEEMSEEVKDLEKRFLDKLERLINLIRELRAEKEHARTQCGEKQEELINLENMRSEKARVKAIMKKAAMKLMSKRKSLMSFMLNNDDDEEDEEMEYYNQEEKRLKAEAKELQTEYQEKDAEEEKLFDVLKDIIKKIDDCKRSVGYKEPATD